MRLSLIIPCLNSHEIVRRQVLHYEAMNLPSDVEVLFIDDGSDPPIETCSDVVKVLRTHDKREWTWPLARNFGARHAAGEYLLMTDLDYIVPREAIEAARTFGGDKLRFKREFGVLDENGLFTQEPSVLMAYGLPEHRIKAKQFRIPPHPNNFVMRKELFLAMGGYVEDRVGRPYPQREDGEFKRRWMSWVAAGKCRDSDERPLIYMFPNGQFCNGDVDHNPFGLFHNLSRKNPKNPWFKKQRYSA